MHREGRALTISVICDYEPDAVPGARPSIFDLVDGKTKLQRAIAAGRNYSDVENPADIVLVLSSSEEVLNAAQDLDAATFAVPSFFRPEEMIKTYFTAGSDTGNEIFIDQNEDPFLVFVDPETAGTTQVVRLRAWLDIDLDS